MNVSPAGIAASVSGAPLAQVKGSEIDRAEADLRAHRRQTDFQHKAEAASGVGPADGEDHQSAERDADGQRPWEDSRPPGDAAATEEAPPPKDPLGQRGGLLDISG